MNPWTTVHQACLSVGFSSKNTGLPFPSPGDLPCPGIKPGSPALLGDSSLSEPPQTPNLILDFISFFQSCSPPFFLPHLPTLLFLLFVSFSILVNCCIIPWNKRQCKIANTWGLIWNLSMWNCMPVNTHQNHPYFEDKMGTPDPFKLINLVPKQRHTYILQHKIQDRHDVTHPGYQTKPRDRAVLKVRVLSRLRTQGSSDRGVSSSGKREDFGKNARHKCQNQAVSPGSRWDQTVYWANVIFPR